ncbi:MAG TPA: family 10 glycosylhydrolase, partial [Bacteroidota bacterium]|nr:family 10 glycosylhydrolase [Bacteroidota bacterium]
MPIRLLLFSTVLLIASDAVAQPAPLPKREVRAVWLTTASGLDWPQTTDRGEQQASLREIVRRLKAYNFNTIFFQIRSRGDAYYRSSFEPWAENLTGTLGKDPGWDPLAFLINEAHEAGIEVHAWFNVYKVRANGSVPITVPPHVSRAHPGWTFNYHGEGWLDPGIPEVGTYLLAVVMDLARKYDIDGINFDYLRYPGRDFSDGDSYRRFGLGIPRDRWRKSNLDRFVGECYDRLTALRPLLKIGSSPLGIYGPDTGFVSVAAGEYYQDTRTWLKTGKLDYVAPQVYWAIGGSRNEPDYATLVPAWQQLAGVRHVYAGIGAYKSDVAREIPREIDVSRNAGNAGQSFFRYESIRMSGLFGGRYALPALIPPMSWKDSTSPPPPVRIAVNELTTNVFEVEWVAPQTVADRSRAFRWVLYRWTSPQIPFDDPRSIAQILPGMTTACTDTVRVPTGGTYYYAVSAVNAANSEGAPSQISSGTMQEFLSLSGKLTERTGLSALLSPGGRTPRMLAYSLARKTAVTLDLLSKPSGSSDTILTTLVSDTQETGVYIVGLSGVQ